MSTPLSFCDIGARYGQTPAPRQTSAEQTGWDAKQLFLDYMNKVREYREKSAKEAEEDALMAMIDAMNAPKEDRESGKTDMELANSLMDAGKAIVAQSEEIQDDGTKVVRWVDPTKTLTVQVLMACLGDRFNFEQADEIQEDQEEARELQEIGEHGSEEEGLEVTETRDFSGTSDPNEFRKEV